MEYSKKRLNPVDFPGDALPHGLLDSRGMRRVERIGPVRKGRQVFLSECREFSGSNLSRLYHRLQGDATYRETSATAIPLNQDRVDLGRLPSPMTDEGATPREQAPLIPAVTWVIVALNILIFLWDRQGNYNNIPVVFADLAMRPREVVMAMHRGADHFPLVTLFTSMFLHANVLHIGANMIFLLVFGPQVEQALGSSRFAIYYFFWGLVAWGAQIYIDPTSSVPTLGASGAIGGVLGCYFLLFPSHKIDLVLFGIEVSAWIFLGLWFLYQIFSPTEGVANWAHVGGFTAGMATVLIAGGRKRLLRGRTDLEPDYV